MTLILNGHALIVPDAFARFTGVRFRRGMVQLETPEGVTVITPQEPNPQVGAVQLPADCEPA